MPYMDSEQIKNISEHSIKSLNNGKITNNGYIVGKYYDSIWFIGAPAIAFISALVFHSTAISEKVLFAGTVNSQTVYNLFIGSFIMAHLFAVFFRSHLNPQIFKLHPIRFIVIPIALILSMTVSLWAAVFFSVLATWWDVYHSGLQTFGLGRIYDSRVGNDHKAGRRLDYLLNILIYAGPILAGATLMNHAKDFQTFEKVNFTTLSILPIKIFNHRDDLTLFVFFIGIPFILYYLYSYWKLHKAGYVFSTKKVILFALTAVVSITCWGFNSFGEAFFIMIFFHAWQYLAIIWHFEEKTITKTFRQTNIKNGKFISLTLFIIVVFAYGAFATLVSDDNNFLYAVILTVSILHFWYDGFIWSVKKKQV